MRYEASPPLDATWVLFECMTWAMMQGGGRVVKLALPAALFPPQIRTMNMKRSTPSVVLFLWFILGQVAFLASAETTGRANDESKPPWQGFEYVSDRDQRMLTTMLEIGVGKWSLPTPFANIASIRVGRPPLLGDPLKFEFNNDASQITVLLPQPKLGQTSLPITLQTVEQTQQTADGQIIFSALDATVDGENAKLESHPGNHRIGFWSNPSDSVRWDYHASRTGTYHVTLTYSKAGADDTGIALEMAGKTLKAKLAGTGSWYRYSTIPIGSLELQTEGSLQLVVKLSFANLVRL